MLSSPTMYPSNAQKERLYKVNKGVGGKWNNNLRTESKRRQEKKGIQNR